MHYAMTCTKGRYVSADSRRCASRAISAQTRRCREILRAWCLATVSTIGDIHPVLLLKGPATSVGTADADPHELALLTVGVELLPWETALELGRYGGDPRSCWGALCGNGVSLVGLCSRYFYQVRWEYFTGNHALPRGVATNDGIREGTAGLVSGLKPILIDRQTEGRGTKMGSRSTSLRSSRVWDNLENNLESDSGGEMQNVDATNRGGKCMYRHLCFDDQVAVAHEPQDLRSHEHLKGLLSG